MRQVAASRPATASFSVLRSASSEWAWRLMKSRTSYWRMRARRAVSTALNRLSDRIGLSTRVTFPRKRSELSLAIARICSRACQDNQGEIRPRRVQSQALAPFFDGKLERFLSDDRRGGASFQFTEKLLWAGNLVAAKFVPMQDSLQEFGVSSELGQHQHPQAEVVGH